MEHGRRAILFSRALFFPAKLIFSAFLAAGITTISYAESSQNESLGKAVAVDKDKHAPAEAASASSQDTTRVSVSGDPLAPGIMELLKDEVEGGFRRRRIEPEVS